MPKIAPRGLIRAGGTYDYLVGGHVVTEHARAVNHTGRMFTSYYLVEHGSELANDDFVDFALHTPTTGVLHITSHVELGGEANAEFWERSTAVTGGTSIAIYNMNRNKNHESNVSASSNPDITGSTGTLLTDIYMAGGSGPKASGDSESVGRWVLRQDTNYILRLYNRSGSAQMGEIRFTWIEEPD